MLLATLRRGLFCEVSVHTVASCRSHVLALRRADGVFFGELCLSVTPIAHQVEAHTTAGKHETVIMLSGRRTRACNAICHTHAMRSCFSWSPDERAGGESGAPTVCARGAASFLRLLLTRRNVVRGLPAVGAPVIKTD